jgi:hypothetical protein
MSRRLVCLALIVWVSSASAQAPTPPLTVYSMRECQVYEQTCRVAIREAQQARQACNKEYFQNDHNRVSGNLSKYGAEFIRDVRFASCPGDTEYVPPKCDAQGENACATRYSCTQNVRQCRAVVASLEEQKAQQRDMDHTLRVLNPIAESYLSNGVDAVGDIAEKYVRKDSKVKQGWENKGRYESAMTFLAIFRKDTPAQDRTSAIAQLGLDKLDDVDAFSNPLSALLTRTAYDTVIGQQFAAMEGVEKNFADFDLMLKDIAETGLSAYQRDLQSLPSSAGDTSDLFAMLRGEEQFTYKGKAVSQTFYQQRDALERQFAALEAQQEATHQENLRMLDRVAALELQIVERNRLNQEAYAQREEEAEKRRQDRIAREEALDKRRQDRLLAAQLREEQEEMRRQQEELEDARRRRDSERRSTLSDSVNSILNTYQKSKSRNSGSTSSSSTGHNEEVGDGRP